MYDGREVVGLRLNFSKRYITLAPIATVIGLAFRLQDPDRLLSDDTDPGITVALIPRDTPGITIGRGHPDALPRQREQQGRQLVHRGVRRDSRVDARTRQRRQERMIGRGDEHGLRRPQDLPRLPGEQARGESRRCREQDEPGAHRVSSREGVPACRGRR